MATDTLVLQIVAYDGFGGPSEDGKNISVEMTASDGRIVELQCPTHLAEIIVAAISTTIEQAKTIAANKGSSIAGFAAEDLELYRDATTGNYRIDFSAKDQPGLTVFVPMHRLQKLGSAIDRILLSGGRAN